MANLRVPYQITSNPVGAILAEAVSLIRRAHDATVRANAILVSIGSDADIETTLGMAHDLSYGAALVAIIGAAKTGLDTIAADVVGRLDQNG